MSKCRSCDVDLDWCTVDGRRVPLESGYCNIHEDKSGKDSIVTDAGGMVKGIVVGDAYEDGYSIGRIVHWSRCNGIAKP